MATTKPELDYTTGLFDAAIDDTVVIAAEHYRTREWQEANGKNTFTDILDSQADLLDLQNYYIAGGGNVFVARTALQPISSVCLRNDGNDHGTLKRMFTIPEYQGLGVGSDVMEYVLEWSRQAGFVQLELVTGKKEDGQHLYKKFGFVVLGEHDYKNWAMRLVL